MRSVGLNGVAAAALSGASCIQLDGSRDLVWPVDAIIGAIADEAGTPAARS